MEIDHLDHKILKQLQISCDQSLEQLGAAVGLSRNAVWRRIKALEDQAVITGGVALVNPEKLGLGLLVFIQIKTVQHSVDWTCKLAQTAAAIPQVIGLYRMSGDLDYPIKAQVASIAGYDRLYQRLISAQPLMDVSASFVTDSIKNTTEGPIFM